jgi:hypothetical protein
MEISIFPFKMLWRVKTFLPFSNQALVQGVSQLLGSKAFLRLLKHKKALFHLWLLNLVYKAFPKGLQLFCKPHLAKRFCFAKYSPSPAAGRPGFAGARLVYPQGSSGKDSSIHRLNGNLCIV